MPWLFATIALNFIPAIFQKFDLDSLALTLSDVQILCLSIGAYSLIPVHLWRAKILSSIVKVLMFVTLIHNILVDYDLIIDENMALYVCALIFVIFVTLSAILMTRWDHLPVEEIVEGTIYEIVGKPKNGLQMVGFYLTAGKGGEHAYTDGKKCWKFSSDGEFTKKELDQTYLIGKKVIRSNFTSEKLDQLIGVKWSIFNNCSFMLMPLKGKKHDYRGSNS